MSYWLLIMSYWLGVISDELLVVGYWRQSLRVCIPRQSLGTRLED